MAHYTNPKLLIASGTANMSASYTGNPVFLGNEERVQLFVSASGLPSGILTIQASLAAGEPKQNFQYNIPSGSWYDIAGMTHTMVSGSPGLVAWSDDWGALWIRAKWTATTGSPSGSLDVTVVGKKVS